MGIEPTYSAWKADVLPLNYTRIQVGVTGFEPATPWSQTRCSSQAEPHPGLLKTRMFSRAQPSAIEQRESNYIIQVLFCQQFLKTFFTIFFYNFFSFPNPPETSDDISQFHRLPDP